ncbi:hypothetical protein PG993_014384 [Apiospora rasikravindrae]|uniref:Alkyl hydroperoxide reductase subunit C/ Thiol specific antioxidant domain-containing protein n=1 Tax=Apiospora rasikravindrae TaxID=990691 RepID=A0ABR1RMM6_9PEZI
MFSSLSTKLAMRKVGIKSDTFDFSSPEPKRGSKGAPEDDEPANGGWAQWMTVKKLPLTAQAWLSPLPPPVPIAPECPKVGDLAPLDRDRQLQFGGGKRIVVLFLRCVGCAFAQKSFLALRTLANRHQGKITCVAVSHSSRDATRKWMDLLGGAWNVEVLIDEDRAIYAAWGLGLGSVWYMFNPTTFSQGWKEKGWLGEKVAGSINRTGSMGPGAGAGAKNNKNTKGGAAAAGAAAAEEEDMEGPSTALGNKWQQAGVFAIDGRGTVVYAEKATRADDVMNLDAAVQILGL